MDIQKVLGKPYRYRDMCCKMCCDYKCWGTWICPHIMENLDDLMKDAAFLSAIENAEKCKNGHRRT